MERLVLARHAEAESNVGETVSGIPPGGPLTPAGVDQARALGRALAGEVVDLAVVTDFRRTQETADIALEGRNVPRLVLPDLNEIRYGRFEGGLLSDYRAWAWEAPADARSPGDGESRGQAAGRYARAFGVLQARPERTILVVAHAVPIRYLLWAAEGLAPSARIEAVLHAEPFSFEAARVRDAVALLEAWSRDPVFAESRAQ